MRNGCGRAADSISCLSRRPASPPKPALMTTAAFVPRRASCAMTSGTVDAGVAITAKSGTFGSPSTSS